MDFSSNDYLGLARSSEQKALVEARYKSLTADDHRGTGTSSSAAASVSLPTLGSTGSRLLSGDSTYARQLEQRLARWHNRPAALLCNSGYDANLAVLSCLPCDEFLFDEYAHNSLRMGMRLAKKRRTKDNQPSNTHKDDEEEIDGGLFLHNSVQDLHRKLKAVMDKRNEQRKARRILIVVESVYSMDGDVAPLQEMLDLALRYGALVMVDEAHGLGTFGDDTRNNSRGTGVLTQLGLEHHPALACSVHTFGKAAGCHGAVICGSKRLRQYLWNYGWPLIYSTSLPLHSLVAIECAYETMTRPRGKRLRQHTDHLVTYFRQSVEERIIAAISTENPGRSSTTTLQAGSGNVYLLPSTSPIQALVLPIDGNQACTEFCERLWKHSGCTIRLYPIKSPTVPAGMERIRIVLHGHNTTKEVDRLVDCMVRTLVDMRLLSSSSSVPSTPRITSKL